MNTITNATKIFLEGLSRYHDGRAREQRARLALRANDLELLQRLASEDPELGRRVFRRLVDGGHRWTTVISGERGRGEDHWASKIRAVMMRDDTHTLTVPVMWEDCRMRLFACDCAKHVMETYYPRSCITAALRASDAYARGTGTQGEMQRCRGAVVNLLHLTIPDHQHAMGEMALAVCGPKAADACAAASRQALGFMSTGHAANRAIRWQRTRLLEYLLDEVPVT